MAIQTWDEETFCRRIGEGPTVVDFWAIWCGHCRRLDPALELTAAAHPEITAAKVDIDSSPALALAYGVTSIPTLAAFRDGEETARLVGPESAEQVEAFFAACLS